jgi:transcriptional regulator with XRE-family HTH domain
VTSRGAFRTAEQLFGEEISKLRRTRGFSQEELGFQAGLHRTYVSQIERGLKSPTLAVILKLSQALGCPAGRLVTEVEKRLKK